ncbi:ankyrin repeat-containing protein [Rhizodiscina lignyota]|uniref:Ankyrin repeat domain-containing protein 54 n=1 Tax=Rhizodiscina lignyota TaxID=1504668 RepID=A0A9P4I7F4_9PEZI|nr:ankyrin repeat-containing protein [Rhizodiscina lignyota]
MPPPPTPIPNISVLLNLVPDRPSSVLQSLAQHPSLASEQDEHGYSLVHAATSYAQLDLLRELVRNYGVDVNLRDEDGETPLFVVESEEIARCLVEELGADIDAKNSEGMAALEKIEGEGDYPEVVEYLRTRSGPDGIASTSTLAEQQTNGVHPPPPLPPNVQINLGTVQEPPEDGPDPEFRRRIEELAARDDFQSDQGQAQLRELITDAVRGVAADADGDSRGSAQRRVE